VAALAPWGAPLMAELVVQSWLLPPQSSRTNEDLYLLLKLREIVRDVVVCDCDSKVLCDIPALNKDG
jgi:hypothetical protein